MSLIMVTCVDDGILMAADTLPSLSYPDGTPLADYMPIPVDKLFKCPNGCGIAICGNALGGTLALDCSRHSDRAYLAEIRDKITYMNDSLCMLIKDKIEKNACIDDIPQLLLEHYPATLECGFIIAGYINQEQRVYAVFTKNRAIVRVDLSKFNFYPLGDAESLYMLFMNPSDESVNYDGLHIAENLYTLDDAYSLSDFAFRATISTRWFKQKTVCVGAPFDYLVIQPEQTVWVPSERKSN